MKYQKTKDGHKELVIDSFAGLDRSTALCGGKGSFELCNLRCMSDGTLVRRPGLLPLATFPATVRGAVSVLRGGGEEGYAVAGDTVYYLGNMEDGCSVMAIGTLGTQTGEVSFLCYEASLLMLDGEELYTLTPTGAVLTEAYVPLYGREWQSGDVATHVMHEAPNMLSRRLRLQYRMTAAGKILPLNALKPESVDAILIDGELYRGNYSYSENGRMISLGDEQEGGSLVEVYLTMPEDGNVRGQVTQAGGFTAIDRAEESRVLFYGGPLEGRVWISRRPDDAGQEGMNRWLSDMCMLYVTKEDLLTIGDGVHAVTGAVRHYDRSLVFTAKGTWMSRGEQNADGTLRFIPVNTTLGCSSVGGAVMLGNRPITVYGHRILSWNSDTDERDECNASPLSTPVDVLLNGMKGGIRAFCDAVRGDAWFYCPGQISRVVIYQSEQDAWTTYDGMAPQCVALLCDQVCVGMGKTLYRLVDDATADTIVDEAHPEGVRVGIKARYESAFWDFDASDRPKRLCRGTVVAACGDGGLTMTLQNVSGRRVSLYLQGDGKDLSVMQGRAPMGRFRFLRVGMVSEDDAPLRLHSIRLNVCCP